MTESIIAFTEYHPGQEAGLDLGRQIKARFGQKRPDAVIVFASSIYDYDSLLKALKSACHPQIIVGASSAGEFTSMDFQTDSACAVAISSDEIQFRCGSAKGIADDREKVAQKLYASLEQEDTYQFQYHSAMVFTDALAGFTDELIEFLTEKTGGKYQFFGGGAGDNANFKRTHVFCGDKAFTDAAVILELLSNKPIGVGISHGWTPASKKMRVTAAEGRRLISLNARPAIELYKEYAKEKELLLNLDQPIPFFLNNILGIEIGDTFKLRAPLAIDDGGLILASDIPVGAYVYIMASDTAASQQAAVNATKSALSQLGDSKPNVALFFDCVATRLRLGAEFDFELHLVNETLNGIPYAGCNTYGQVARINGQFSGFQNCSAVVCVIPE